MLCANLSKQYFRWKRFWSLVLQCRCVHSLNANLPQYSAIDTQQLSSKVTMVSQNHNS